jgi:GYF domain 2
MPAEWYYKIGGTVFGPVEASELKRLTLIGQINASTIVRGADGAWHALGRLDNLLESARAGERAAAVDQSAAMWRVSRSSQKQLGPIAWSELKAMADRGKLRPTDQIWKPGMPLWVAASTIAELWVDPAPAAPAGQSRWRILGMNAGPPVRRPWLVAGGALGLLALGVGWYALTSRSRGERAGLTDRSENTRPNDSPASDGSSARPRVPDLLDDALSAIRLGELERATRLLDEFIPKAGDTRALMAKGVRAEIELASSDANATALAKKLSDRELGSYVQSGVQSLLATIATLELRPVYERTLLQAFRREYSRRQFTPRLPIGAEPAEGPPRAAAAQPEPPTTLPNQDADGLPPPAESSKKGSALGGSAPPKPGAEPKADNRRIERRSDATGATLADLKDVLLNPNAYRQQSLLLNGVFKIGTRVAEVKGTGGKVIGWSIPVARNDGTILCRGDDKIAGRDTYLLLDDRLARFLDLIFAKLAMNPTPKPTYKCALTVTPRRLDVNGTVAPAVMISALEVLGWCDYVKIASHQYQQAFRTLMVTPDEAYIDFGDGDSWVERLGGEEQFVTPLKRKFREMQRRAASQRELAMLDNAFQREMASSPATAGILYRIRAVEGMMRSQVSP